VKATTTHAPLDCALLIGQGRSGTNFLLSLFDQSPLTHCRNEPDQLDRSSLAALAEFRFFVDDDLKLEGKFDRAFREAALCIGPRDHVAAHPKAWLRPSTQRAGFFLLRQRYRAVERLWRRRKPMDGREVRFPRWMIDPLRLERSLHVFKLNAAVGLGTWALRHRREMRLIQIVRHPAGFLKSWLRRWVKGEGGQDRGQGTRDLWRDEDRLRELARRDPAWQRTLGDVDAMSRTEGELWWWRYVNETLWREGCERESYRLVLYEDLAARPVELARELFETCGLHWDDELSARAGRLAKEPHKDPRAWRDELDEPTVEIVERVLAGSPMAGWWSER
jgi:hypothetical protein